MRQIIIDSSRHHRYCDKEKKKTSLVLAIKRSVRDVLSIRIY